uniref:Uncharacterized protein n=1 Tax=Parascaris equorum TaxID=6256 RepID=A0A914RVL2_PAREQ
MSSLFYLGWAVSLRLLKWLQSASQKLCRGRQLSSFIFEKIHQGDEQRTVAPLKHENVRCSWLQSSRDSADKMIKDWQCLLVGVDAGCSDAGVLFVGAGAVGKLVIN